MGNQSIPNWVTRVSPSHSMTYYAYAPRSDGGRYATTAHEFRAAGLLTPKELDVLADADVKGWLCRSGQRMQALSEWTRRCRVVSWPVIVGIRLATVGIVEVNGREAWRGPVEDLEREAARIVGQQAGLFDGGGVGHLPRPERAGDALAGPCWEPPDRIAAAGNYPSIMPLGNHGAQVRR